MKMFNKLLIGHATIGLGSILLLLSGCGENTSPVSRQRDKLVHKATPKDSDEVIWRLEQGNASERQEAVQRIISAPDQFTPPVFYVLSSVLFEQGKKNEAAFWFYAGQLRGRFDANRCADISARQTVQVFNLQYGTAINQYMFNRIEKLKALIPKVVEWDRKTPHNYDHRWINSYGMDAVKAELSGRKFDASSTSVPQDQWTSIAEKTRTEYLAAFRTVTSPTQFGHPKEFFSDPDVASLALAAENGDIKEINRLVASGVDVNAVGKDGLTPLLWAMVAKNKQSFKRLLELGANPNAQVGEMSLTVSPGDSPISLAARIEDDSEWLELVLAHDGDPNVVNPTDDILFGKRTPIFDAIYNRNQKNVELLINAGSDLNHADDIGETPLIYAAQRNAFAIVYQLLEAGADYRKKDKYGYDLAKVVANSRIGAEYTESIQWREEVIEFLRKRGVNLQSGKEPEKGDRKKVGRN